MRVAGAALVLTFAFTIGAASRSAAQDQVAQRTDSAAVQVSQPVDSAAVVKVRKPEAGPRLPEFVASIPLPLEAPAPAAPNNIVIPVTTALIVLAVVVMILLID
jgi:hypothetical protein